eukprot:c19438_g1_i2 orf=443-1015(-)
MAGLDQSTIMRGITKEKMDYFGKPLPIIKQENEKDSTVAPKEKDLSLTVGPKEEDTVSKEKGIKEHGYGVADNFREGKRIKLQENGSTTLEKLQNFFDIVQKQHPESRLELQYVDGNWKVWCGVCKKLLRPDKSGKAIHNIQRQHFSSSRHKKKLHLMFQAAEDAAEGPRKHAVGKGNEIHNSAYTAETK